MKDQCTVDVRLVIEVDGRNRSQCQGKALQEALTAVETAFKETYGVEPGFPPYFSADGVRVDLVKASVGNLGEPKILLADPYKFFRPVPKPKPKAKANGKAKTNGGPQGNIEGKDITDQAFIKVDTPIGIDQLGLGVGDQWIGALSGDTYEILSVVFRDDRTIEAYECRAIKKGKKAGRFSSSQWQCKAYRKAQTEPARDDNGFIVVDPPVTIDKLGLQPGDQWVGAINGLTYEILSTPTGADERAYKLKEVALGRLGTDVAKQPILFTARSTTCKAYRKALPVINGDFIELKGQRNMDALNLEAGDEFIGAVSSDLYKIVEVLQKPDRAKRVAGRYRATINGGTPELIGGKLARAYRKNKQAPARIGELVEFGAGVELKEIGVTFNPGDELIGPNQTVYRIKSAVYKDGVLKKMTADRMAGDKVSIPSIGLRLRRKFNGYRLNSPEVTTRDEINTPVKADVGSVKLLNGARELKDLFLKAGDTFVGSTNGRGYEITSIKLDKNGLIQDAIVNRLTKDFSAIDRVGLRISGNRLIKSYTTAKTEPEFVAVNPIQPLRELDLRPGDLFIGYYNNATYLVKDVKRTFGLIREVRADRLKAGDRIMLAKAGDRIMLANLRIEEGRLIKAIKVYR